MRGKRGRLREIKSGVGRGGPVHIPNEHSKDAPKGKKNGEWG